MITVEEIRQKALRRYEEYLRSIVIEEAAFFPLEIKGNKQGEKDIEGLLEQQLPLFQNSKENAGFGYRIESEMINGRRGVVPAIRKIEFETEADYLKFIHKEIEAHNFKLLLTATLAEFPELKLLLIDKPTLLAENILSWSDLLAVCRYFKKNPSPGLYIRELPVPVHTKFIEAHKSIIANLLTVLIPEHVNVLAESFEDKFHLKSKHNLIRIRFLDTGLSSLPGFDEIGIAETEISNLPITCKRVFIIENDITGLTFPKCADSNVLFGKGYNLSSLKRIEWLKPVEIYYWSDMDVQGFEMLSQIRSYFPQVQNFLMDELSFRQFISDAGVGTKSRNAAPPHLTHAEKTLYHLLSSDNIRLEQEKIPQSWVESQLHLILSGKQ